MRHRFRTYGRWLALVAIAGASTVGLAPQAGAYTPGGAVPTIDVVNCTAAAAGRAAPDPIDIPTLTFGATGQAAGCWAIKADPGEAWQNGDQVVIAVDDDDGDDPYTNPGQVTFSAAPTVKLGDQTLTNVTLLSGGQRLRITVTGLSAPTFADMVITNVKYDVGFKAPSADNAKYGLVQVRATLNGDPGTDVGTGPLTLYSLGQESNAFLSDVSLTANDPEVGIDINAFPGTAKASISNIVLKEASTSALSPGPRTICIRTDGLLGGTLNPDTVDFSSADSSSTGDATLGGVSLTNANTLALTFTIPSPHNQANTFTISNVKVDPVALGRILIRAWLDANGDCGNETAGDVPLSPVAKVTLFVPVPVTFTHPLTTAGAVVYQERFGGSDRFQTARRIAEDRFFSTDAAVIARADDFADALAASGLAGKVAEDIDDDVPILLTRTDSIPSATLNALTTLGVKTVYIVGGTQAVSQAVENQLRNKPAPGSGVFCPGSDTTQCLRVVRIAGADRYATAQEIADFMGTAGTVDLDKSDGLDDDLKTAFLARGDVFADALAVGPLAYEGASGSGDFDPMPVLLTQSTSLSPAARAALIDLGIEQVVIAGGTAAVSQAVEDAVKAMGIKVVRVGGTNRQHTATLIAGMALDPDTFEFEGDCVILARGDDFPDALAAGPFGGDWECPIVLTEARPSDDEGAKEIGVFTTGFLDLTSALVLPDLYVVGQTAAVADAAATQARNALSGTTLQP